MFAIAACAQADEASLREQFTKTLQDIQSGDADGRDSEALRGYVLHPYLEAARLRLQVQQAAKGEADAAVKSFLDAHGNEPVTQELRRDWLQSLARRDEWMAYRAAYREAQADADQRCQHLLARIKTNDSTLDKKDALKVWMSGQMQPNTCIPAFDWIAQRGWIGEAERAERAQLALQNGNADLAEALAADMSAAAAAPVLRWVRLIRTPQAALEEAIRKPAEKIDPAALLDGFTRLARKDAAQAQKLYAPLLKSQHLGPKAAAPFTYALAMGFATSRQPQAVQYFRQTPESALDDKGREWRIRAAVWNGDWSAVAQWSLQLSPTLAAMDRWNYWRARALEQSPKTQQQAHNLYRELAHKNNWYGALAAHQLGQRHTPQPQPLNADPAVQAALLQNPAIVRARELFYTHCNDWAVQEWRAALQNLNTATQQQAGLLASSWGWHAQAIPTLAATAVYDDFKITYPLSYEPLVEQAAERAELPPAWLYGVMRQESLYDARAVSPANAYGLLQLLLPTARNVARQWKRPAPSRDDLFDPATNLTLGAAYLHDLIAKWNGSLVLALGSYNAGPQAVERWLPDAPKDADVWIENVPYGETRGYIQRILWHISVFGWRESGQPQDLSPLLKPIVKRAS